MTEHRSLTGASLHESKGVDTAASGTVYVADGAGSGSWTQRLLGIFGINKYALTGQIADASEPNSAFFSIPQNGQLNKLAAVLSKPITTANAGLTIYKNNVVQTGSLTVNYTGSTAGSSFVTTLSPTVAVVAGDVIEIRGDGGSTGVAPLFLTLTFAATA